MSRFTEKKSEIWAKYGQWYDAITWNFLKKLDSTDSFMWVLEGLDF